MKKTLIILLALVMAFITGPAFAAVSGSAHDFSDGIEGNGGSDESAWNSSGEICITCHTPHNAEEGMPVLWNRAQHDNSTYQTVLTTAYGNTWGTPNAASLMCLSCHDGTIALDSYGGTTGSVNIQAEYDANVRVGDGTTLEGNHPISIDYDDTIQRGTHDEFVAVGSLNSAIKLFGDPGSEQIECSSCHDVHDVAVQDDLLRMSNTASALCLACHIK